MTSRQGTQATVMLTLLALVGCGSHSSTATPADTSAVRGTYVASGQGAIASITFEDATHYTMHSGSCANENPSKCSYSGTYAFNAAGSELSLTDSATGQVETLAFKMQGGDGEVDLSDFGTQTLHPLSGSVGQLVTETCVPLTSSVPTVLLNDESLNNCGSAPVCPDTMQASDGITQIAFNYQPTVQQSDDNDVTTIVASPAELTVSRPLGDDGTGTGFKPSDNVQAMVIELQSSGFSMAWVTNTTYPMQYSGGDGAFHATLTDQPLLSRLVHHADSSSAGSLQFYITVNGIPLTDPVGHNDGANQHNFEFVPYVQAAGKCSGVYEEFFNPGTGAPIP